MYEVLDNEAKVKVDGRWLTLKAVLTTSVGGQRVEYLDEEDKIIHHQPYSRSPYYKKDSDK